MIISCATYISGKPFYQVGVVTLHSKVCRLSTSQCDKTVQVFSLQVIATTILVLFLPSLSSSLLLSSLLSSLVDGCGPQCGLQRSVSFHLPQAMCREQQKPMETYVFNLNSEYCIISDG